MNKIPFYFPLANGHYDVKPGLFPLGTDFGNNTRDHLIFQIDSNHHEYILQKKRVLTENVKKYFCSQQPSLQGLVQVSQYIAKQLCHEYPEYFRLSAKNDQIILQSRFDSNLNPIDIYIPTSSANADTKQMLSVVNALMQQIQEDIALIELDPNGQDYISLLHLCYPNHWGAEKKIGTSFIEAHNPVPEMSSINKRSQQILRALIHKGPFVRFAWGLSFDKVLNHHPLFAENCELTSCRKRDFNSLKPELFLRVERQTSTGFPKLNSFLFTIRTYLYDVADIKKAPPQREALIASINSMSEASLNYKGLSKSKNEILRWLSDVS